MKAAARLLLILALAAPAFASAQSAQAPAPAPTCRLYASASVVNYNTKVRLDWSSRGATSGYLTDVGAIPAGGSTYVVPGKNTTYAASFSGPGGVVVCRVGVVIQTSSLSDNGAAYSGGVVNVDGTADFRGTSIDASTPVNTSGGTPIDTAPIGTGIDTAQPVNTTGHPIDTAPIGTGVDTTGNPINTNQPINTTGGPNLNGTVNLGGNVTIPTAPSVAPSTAAPASGGLLGGIVPQECRGNSTIANCDLCSLAQMGQNLANFGIGLTIPAAVLLFAWVGILYFSARGKESQITQAHKVFRSVVIGLVIAIAAFMLVNTIMKMLVHGTDFNGWNWQTLNCTQTRTARLYNMSLSAYLQSSLNSLSSYTPTGQTGGSATGCVTGTLVGTTCQDPSGAVVGTPTTVITGDGAMTCEQYGSGYAVAGGQCYPADSTISAGPARSAIDNYQDVLGDECDDGNTASCKKLEASLAASDPSVADTAGNNYTSEQKVLLSSCRGGDFSSCDAFSKSSGSGDLGARISTAAGKYDETDTSAGPDGGNKACAWAVNNILQSAGIAPVDGNSVALMQEQLELGRGVQVGTDSSLANTKAGDIVVWKSDTMSHVGICDNDGCTKVESNSSAEAKFNTETSASFNGQSTSKIYRVTK
jgi:hypothetical protein